MNHQHLMYLEEHADVAESLEELKAALEAAFSISVTKAELVEALRALNIPMPDPEPWAQFKFFVENRDRLEDELVKAYNEEFGTELDSSQVLALWKDTVGDSYNQARLDLREALVRVSFEELEDVLFEVYKMKLVPANEYEDTLGWIESW
jgi:hypothetical protein